MKDNKQIIYSTPYNCWIGYQLLVVYEKETKK